MKRKNLKSILFLLLFVVNAQAFHQDNHPDIVIQTQFNYHWSSFLVQKISNFLAKSEIGDPRDRVLEEPIIIEEFIFQKNDHMRSSGPQAEKSTDKLLRSMHTELETTMVPETANEEALNEGGGKNIMARLMENKNINKAKIRVVINKLGYKINRVGFGITADKESYDNFGALMKVHVGNILVKAEDISVAIMLPVRGEYKNFIEFKLTRPFIKTPSSYADENGIAPSDITFNFNLKAQKIEDQFKFSLSRASFNDVGTFIEKYGKDIKLAPNMDVNPTPFPLLRLGNVVWILVRDEKTIKDKMAKKEFDLNRFLMDPANFGITKPELKRLEVRFVDMTGYFNKHQDDIKAMLLTEMFNTLSNGTGDKLLANLENFRIDGNQTINGGDIVGKMGIEKITTNEESQVHVQLSSGFCTGKDFKDNVKECIKFTKPVRELSESQMHNSLDEITQSIKDNEADLVVSLSESYISHILRTTYNAGMWKDALSGQPIEMNDDINPNFMFMALDRKGALGTLVMDVDYVGLNKVEAVAVGKKRIRVALKYDVAIEIAKKDDIPHLLVTMTGADASDKTIIYGVPEWGVPSEIQTVKRLKKAVVKSSRTEILLAVGTQIAIPIPELTNLGFDDLQYVRFASDGNGRANLQLKVKDSIKFRHVAPKLSKAEKEAEEKVRGKERINKMRGPKPNKELKKQIR